MLYLQTKWKELKLDKVLELEDLSLREVEEFLSNPIWKYFVSVLEQRLEMVRNELENATLSTEEVKLRQGECRTIRYFKDQLPMLTIEQLKEIQTLKETEERSNERSGKENR